MLRQLVLIAIIVALAVGVDAQPANAQEPIDISGEWLIDGFRLGSRTDECAFTISQAGALLAAVAECESGIHLHGMIDPSTGAFSLSGRSRSLGAFTFVGTATSDHLSLRRADPLVVGDREGVRRRASDQRLNLSGDWTTRIVVDGGKQSCSTSVWHRAEAITIDLECRDQGIAHLTGAIDMETGRLAASGDLFGARGKLEGYASRSGRALSGIWSAPGVGSGTLTSVLAGQTGGALAVDCDGETEGIQASCAYDVGATFRVQLHLAEAPPQGSNGFALLLYLNTPQLSFLRAESTDEELLEPNCELRDRGGSAQSRSASFACVNQPIPDAEAHQAGVPVEVTLRCSAAGSGRLILGGGTTVVLLNGGLRSVPQTIFPVTFNATVWCRPDASSQPGDVNCNGLVNSIDALLVLQLESMKINTLACIDRADSNQDGVVNSIDAALILQFAAGLMAAQAAST